jgi:hypothetical protein
MEVDVPVTLRVVIAEAMISQIDELLGEVSKFIWVMRIGPALPDAVLRNSPSQGCWRAACCSC